MGEDLELSTEPGAFHQHARQFLEALVFGRFGRVGEMLGEFAVLAGQVPFGAFALPAEFGVHLDHEAAEFIEDQRHGLRRGSSTRSLVARRRPSESLAISTGKTAAMRSSNR